jgi:hypothetical protein
MDHPSVVFARDLFFKVDVSLLQDEFASYSEKPPAAFDVRLYQAAQEHCNDLITRDAQDHLGQMERIPAFGFSFGDVARGNVFSYSRSALFAHAAFNIDWGPDELLEGDGMQTGRGHRMAVMSIDGDYTNVGLAAIGESDPDTQIGPFVITGNYCKANNSLPDHHNRFLVGTVWTDGNFNAIYDPGEGFPGVTVMPDHGIYYAVTSDSGGYAIPILSPGTYHISISNPSTLCESVKTVYIGNQSVLLDFIVDFDADGDMLEDLWEVQHFGDLAESDGTEDFDRDMLSDLEEFQHSTDPTEADSDYDGMPDGWEAQAGLDPTFANGLADADRDGYSNLREYRFRTDPKDPKSRPNIPFAWIFLLLRTQSLFQN